MGAIILWQPIVQILEFSVQCNSLLAETIARYAHIDGTTTTPVTGLKLYRSACSVPRQPVMYAPTICVIAQGAKQIYFGDAERSYDPANYLINSVTLPVEAEVLDTDEDHPYLGLSLDVDSYLIGQLLIDMEQQDAAPRQEADDIIVSTAVTERLESSFLRLLQCLDTPMDMKVLSPTIRREIYYEVLQGPHGDILRNCVLNHTGANRIAPVVHYIEENFEHPLDVDTIARFAGMSSSTLHDHFKQVTSMSPMQFVKSLRLHRAHSLLLSGGQATETSYRVGYNSPSQFSREFKRFFGIPPKEVQAVASR